MELSDYSPAECPSEEEQIDALRKGLGRAVLWAQRGQLSPDILLQACLEDLRCERQCESLRSAWLWQLMGTLGVRDAFRIFILRELANCTCDDEGAQLCRLVAFYAAEGDLPCYQAVRNLIGRKQFPQMPWMGEEELLRLDKLEGVEFIAKTRGRALQDSKWRDDDAHFAQNAIEFLGETAVLSHWSQSRDPDVIRFARAFEASRLAPPAKRSYEERERQLAWPAERVIEEAHSPSLRWSLQSWGNAASEDDLQKVADALWQAKETCVQIRMLRVFRTRGLPVLDTRLFDLARHDDWTVRQHAFSVLANHQHPEVREFAIEQLKPGLTNTVAELFVANFQPGDERLLLDSLTYPVTQHHLHWHLMSVLDVLTEYEEADVRELGVAIYFQTPCSNCRGRAVDLLLSSGEAPAWLIDEARHDAAEKTRRMIEEHV